MCIVSLFLFKRCVSCFWYIVCMGVSGRLCLPLGSHLCHLWGLCQFLWKKNDKANNIYYVIHCCDLHFKFCSLLSILQKWCSNMGCLGHYGLVCNSRSSCRIFLDEIHLIWYCPCRRSKWMFIFIGIMQRFTSLTCGRFLGHFDSLRHLKHTAFFQKEWSFPNRYNSHDRILCTYPWSFLLLRRLS